MGVGHALNFALQTIAHRGGSHTNKNRPPHMQGQRCTRQSAPLCSPNTMLMGLLPWCDW
jgi:hypothetical protein